MASSEWGTANYSPFATRYSPSGARSRDAIAPELACAQKLNDPFASKKMRGGGAPTDARVRCPRHAKRMLPPACATGAEARHR